MARTRPPTEPANGQLTATEWNQAVTRAFEPGTSWTFATAIPADDFYYLVSLQTQTAEISFTKGTGSYPGCGVVAHLLSNGDDLVFDDDFGYICGDLEPSNNVVTPVEGAIYRLEFIYNGSTFNVRITEATLLQPSIVYTDDFSSYSTGSLNGQGDWYEVMDPSGTLSIFESGGDKSYYSSSGDEGILGEGSQSYASDHYAQCKLDAVNVSPNVYVGVACRCGDEASSTALALWVKEDIVRVYQYDEGSFSSKKNSSGYSLTAGDIIRLEVEGTAWRVYINDVLDSSGTTELTGGRPGLSGIYNSTTKRADDFECGDL